MTQIFLEGDSPNLSYEFLTYLRLLRHLKATLFFSVYPYPTHLNQNIGKTPT